MKLKNQVCSLEQAKKLKELGVVQGETLCLYYGNSMGDVLIHRISQEVFSNEWDAFTVAELGVMLPHEIEEDVFLTMEADDENGLPYAWCATYRNWWKRSCHGSSGSQKTESEARAAMLIELLSTGKIKVEEVNKRLSNS